MCELRDFSISMATLSLCLSSKEKHHQEYQWQISFLYLHVGRKRHRESDKYEGCHTWDTPFLSSINWFLATLSTTQLHALCCMQLITPTLTTNVKIKDEDISSVLISLYILKYSFKTQNAKCFREKGSWMVSLTASQLPENPFLSWSISCSSEDTDYWLHYTLCLGKGKWQISSTKEGPGFFECQNKWNMNNQE